MANSDEPDRLWKLTEFLRRERRHEPAPTIEELLERQRRHTFRAEPIAGRRRRWLMAPAIGIAAALLLVAGWLIRREPERPQALLELAEFRTARGELATMTLGDGTIVRLAPESHLTVVPRADERRVVLDGRAFFSVAKHRGRFIVQTAAGEARVLGTQFDVEARDRNLEVLVVEGMVAVTAADHRVELTANQVATVTDRHPPVVSRAADAPARLLWLQDFLAFQATPLGEVVHQLGRRYGVSIQLADSALARETVTGGFAGESLDDLLNVLCRVLDAECRRVTSTTVVIERPSIGRGG